ncbi:MAG: RNA polymerase sigma factor [Planctomycetota bacterium]|jgi:RNA polymerase sigma-70 factor (ECF subfamily)
MAADSQSSNPGFAPNFFGKNSSSAVYDPADGESIGDCRYWPLTERSLLEGIQADGPNPAAWERFVDLYGPLICSFCRRKVDEQASEEITQEVFWRVFRYVKKLDYDPKKGSFGGWIGTVTRNAIKQYYVRKRKDHQGRVDFEVLIREAEAHAPMGEWEDEYNAWVVRRGLEQVRAEVSDCVWNVFEATTDGMSTEEAMETFGVTMSQVYKARFKVAERLRVLIPELTNDYPFADG